MFSSPAVIVHGLEDARNALRVGLPVTLLSAPAAASYAGCGWWQALVRHATAEFPATPATDVLDCGAAPGYAMAALRIGLKNLILDPACPAYDTVAAAASALGATILPERPEALDLAASGALRHLDSWLTGAQRQLPNASCPMSDNSGGLG